MMIKMQWLPLILKGKSTDKAMFLFILRDLFYLGLVLKFPFSFLLFTFTLYLNLVI